MTPLDYASRICYSSRETLEFTHEQAKKYADKEGVYVECGVAAGAQIIAMAYGAPHKMIYAFDSFQGIPLPSNRDDQMPGIMMLTKAEQKALPDPGKQKLETTGATSVSVEDFSEHLDNAFGRTFITPRGGGKPIRYPNVEIVKGWFEETTIGFKEDIALLRLDGDLYNSTLVCLQNLYPKVIKEGIVIVDDWQLPGCRAAVEDYFKGELPNMHFISNIAYFYKNV